MAVGLIVLLLAGCGGSKEEEARSAIQKGDTFFQNKLYSDALSYYEGALEAMPLDPQLHMRIGMCRQNLGRPSDAIKSYEIVIRQDPANKEAYRRKGSLLIESKKMDEAETFADEVMKNEGMEGVGFYIRGELAQAKNEKDRAIENFEKSLEYDTDVTETQEALVQAYRISGQTEPAIELLQKLLEKKPNEIPLVVQLAYLYESEGNTDKAISLISGLINDHPENPRLRSVLARLYLSAGNLDLAEQEAREALSLDPDDANALFVTGSIASEKGDFEQASEDLKAAQDRMPTDETIRKAFREVEMELGRLTDPVRSLKEEIEAQGESPALQTRLAEAYLYSGDAPTALVEIQKVLDKEPDHKEAMIIQAHALLCMGNREAATQVLEKIGESDNPRVQVMLGILNKDNAKVTDAVEKLKSNEATVSWGRYFSGVYKLIGGNLESGISELDEASDADEGFGMPLDELGRLYIGLNEPMIAMNIYGMLAVRFPDSPRPPMMIARLLDSTGETERALVVLNGLAERKPDFQAAKFFAATLHLKSQQYNEAIEIIQGLIDQTKEDPTAQLVYRGVLAKANLFAKDYAKAIEQYDRILEVRPDFPVARVEKALAQMANNNAPQALETATEALNSATEKTIPKIVHSILLQQNGKVVEALQEIQEVAAQVEEGSGKKEDLIPLMASVQIAAGQFDGARDTINSSGRPPVMKEIFIDAIDEAENSSADFGPMSMGYLFGYYGWPDPAIAIHRALMEKYPRVNLMKVNLGEILQQARRTEEAYEIYREAVEQNPDNLYFLRSEAKLASRLDKDEEAMKNLLQAISLSPEDPTLHFQLGTVYEKQGLIDEAISSYEQVIDLKPPSSLEAAAANNLAWLYSQDDSKLDLALEYGEKALELSPVNPRTGWKDGNILDTVGWIYYKKGDYENAGKNIDQALRSIPFHPTINFHRAKIYEEQGQPEVANHLYQKALWISEDFDEAGESRQRLQALRIQQMEKEKAEGAETGSGDQP